MVVAHSMGGTIATELAERDAGLVERLMLIGAPASGRGPRLGDRIAIAPVIGHAINRLATRSFIRSSLADAFSSGTDVPEGFVDDVEAMTFSSLRDSLHSAVDYRRARSLPRRLADNGIPVLVVFGAEDALVDPDEARDYESVPRAEIQILDGVGHSPQVERPALVVRLIRGFARRSGGTRPR